MNTDMKFMKGSEGTPDYLKIMHKQGCALGIKPYVQGIVTDYGVAGLITGVRVRAAIDNTKQIDGKGVFKKSTRFEKVFPLPFTKNNEGDRASVMLSTFTPYKLPTKNKLKRSLKHSADSKAILDFIMDYLKEEEDLHTFVNHDEIHKWINSEWVKHTAELPEDFSSIFDINSYPTMEHHELQGMLIQDLAKKVENAEYEPKKVVNKEISEEPTEEIEAEIPSNVIPFTPKT